MNINTWYQGHWKYLFLIGWQVSVKDCISVHLIHIVLGNMLTSDVNQCSRFIKKQVTIATLLIFHVTSPSPVNCQCHQNLLELFWDERALCDLFTVGGNVEIISQ